MVKTEGSASDNPMRQPSRDRDNYVRMLTRISGDWGDWDEFSQVRHPSSFRYEIRRSTPLCLLAGLACFGLALDFWFFGLLVEAGQPARGLLSASTGAVVLTIGQGMFIDGTSRRVTRWWGWVNKPVFFRSYDFSAFDRVEIAKKLGPKAADPTVGRTVRRPLYLVTSNKRRVLVKTCSWVKGARSLAEDVAGIMSIPVTDLFPEDDDSLG